MRISFREAQLNGTIHLPSSKSLSNRALMIQAYAGTSFDLQNLSASHDTVLLRQLLAQLHQDAYPMIVDVEDAGTPFRFLLSYLAIQEGREFVLRGSERLHQRPIRELVDALRSLGASIEYLEQDGFAPLHITGRKLSGGRVQIHAGISSQFISSLCMLAPNLEHGLTIELQEQPVSDTYIDMTLALMKTFGIESTWQDEQLTIAKQAYQPCRYSVESDWSSACFFYAMAMLADQTTMYLPGLSIQSLQGDAHMATLARDFGIQTSVYEDGLCIAHNTDRLSKSMAKYNLSAWPDLAVPFIVACALRYPGSSISGIQHLEYKESQRLTVLQRELAKIGIHLVVQHEQLTFKLAEDRVAPREIHVNVSGDHRIAMAMTLPALVGHTVHLDDPDCVQKSFPDYFTEIANLGFKIN